MEQEYATKAIFIALSLFVIMLVITLIINYYTAAKEISKQAQEIQRKIDALIKEIEESNGQVGFAFSELIDVTKVKKEKGKK